jgi:hypothetical protein
MEACERKPYLADCVHECPGARIGRGFCDEAYTEIAVTPAPDQREVTLRVFTSHPASWPASRGASSADDDADIDAVLGIEHGKEKAVEIVCSDRTELRRGVVQLSIVALVAASIAGLLTGGLPSEPQSCPGASLPPLVCND